VTLGPKIGAGSFGDVYVGEMDHKKVALKTLKDKDNIAAFIEEVKLGDQLSSPVAVRVYGVTEISKKVFAVLEYCEKGSLLSFLKSEEGKELKRGELLLLAKETAQTLSVLHRIKVVHRDIAARNFLVTNKNEIKLSDFGLAKAFKTDKSYTSEKQENFQFPWAWSPPEVLTMKRYSFQSDIYSLGVTLWEILTRGGQPFATEIPESMLEGAKKGSLPKLFFDEESISKEEYDFILRMTAPNPKDRPELSEVVQKLQTLASQLTGTKKEQSSDDAYRISPVSGYDLTPAHMDGPSKT